MGETAAIHVPVRKVIEKGSKGDKKMIETSATIKLAYSQTAAGVLSSLNCGPLVQWFGGVSACLTGGTSSTCTPLQCPRLEVGWAVPAGLSGNGM